MSQWNDERKLAAGRPIAQASIREVAMTEDPETVTVPRAALKLLYECALSYDTRVPVGNGGDWAALFHGMFAAEVAGHLDS